MPVANASVSVPANLLLMGEYAVLEEGGLGIAVAPEIRATGILSAGPAARKSHADRPRHADTVREPVTVTGRWPGTEVRWPGAEGLLGLAAEHLQRRFPVERPGIRYHIELDTSAFFRPDGGKRGLGSSAAAVVALTALWMEAAGAPAPDPGEHRPGRRLAPPRETLFREALTAHRYAQGGSGSGYDVACCTHGGVVLFCGGQDPVVTALRLAWLPRIRLLQGPVPVRTVSSVARYREWKERRPREAAAFLNESNVLVTSFAAAGDWVSAAQTLAEYTRLAVRLGETIGVPAEPGIPAPSRIPSRTPGPGGAAEDGGAAAGYDSPETVPAGPCVPVVTKCVGAGNEIAVMIGDHSAEGAIEISREGVVWK